MSESCEYIKHNYTPEEVQAARALLCEKVMEYTLERFPNIPDELIERNTLELLALQESHRYCLICAGMADCKDGGNCLYGELTPRGFVHLEMRPCKKQLPIMGTDVKKYKKSRYFK